MEEKHQICCICGKLFTVMDILKTHEIIHTEEKHKICSICGKLFADIDTLKHIRFKHGREASNM